MHRRMLLHTAAVTEIAVLNLLKIDPSDKHASLTVASFIETDMSAFDLLVGLGMEGVIDGKNQQQTEGQPSGETVEGSAQPDLGSEDSAD